MKIKYIKLDKNSLKTNQHTTTGKARIYAVDEFGLGVKYSDDITFKYYDNMNGADMNINPMYYEHFQEIENLLIKEIKKAS